MIHLTAYQKNLVRFAACGANSISPNERKTLVVSSSSSVVSSSSPRYGRRIYRLLFLLFSGWSWIKVASSCLTGTVYPVTHQFGEPIVFPFLHILFFIGEWRLFRLEQDLGILSFCCFMCILLLLLLFFCLSFSVSPFLCLLFSVSFFLSSFLCSLFCVSFFLCVSFSLCLFFSVSFSVSPLLCLSASLCPSIPLSVYCSLLSVSVKFSGSKNNPLLDSFSPCWNFFALLESFPLLEFFPLEFFPLLIFNPLLKSFPC